MKQTTAFYIFVTFVYQMFLFILLTNAKTVPENDKLMDIGLESVPSGLLIEYPELSDSSYEFPMDGASDETSPSSDETSPFSDETSPFSDGTTPFSGKTSSDETSPFSGGTSPFSDKTSSDETSPFSGGTSPFSDDTTPFSGKTSSDETSPFSGGTSPFSGETSSSSDETSSSPDETSSSSVKTSTTPVPTIAPAGCNSSVDLALSGCNFRSYERCDNISNTCVCNAGYAKPLSSTSCIAVDEFEVTVNLQAVTPSSSNSLKRRYRREDGTECSATVMQTISDDILKSLEVSYKDEIVNDGSSTIEQCTIDSNTGILTAKAVLKFQNDSINGQEKQNISSTITNNWPDPSYVVEASPATEVYTTCSETYCDANAVCTSNATQNAQCSCKTGYLDFSPVSSGQICLPNCDSNCNGHGSCDVSEDFTSASCNCEEPYFPDSNCGYNKNVVIGGSVAGGVVLIIIIIVTTVCCCKKSKKSKLTHSKQNLIEEDRELQQTFHIPRARV